MNYTALLPIEPTPLVWLKQSLGLPEIALSCLPAKLSQRLWVSPAEFLEVTSAPVLAQWAVQVSGRWRPALPEPTSRRGPKPVYEDWSVMLVALVQVAWQMEYAEVIDYFRAHPQTAQLAGFSPERVISIGHYWERRRAIGVLPFWFLFIAFVAQLIYLGVITGTDVILDATTLQAWFRHDPEAKWSFPKPWKGSVWGYKVHTLLCRWSQLPVMFLVTPAHRQDSPFAITLLTLAAVCLGLPIALVRADAGYFTLPIMCFIRTVLKASFVIDYNLRRQGKRFLATLFFIEQWRFHLRPRAIIERHFAWAKRYFGLQQAHWSGLIAAYQHTALVYCTMLAVALIAHRYQRPDLAGSRTRVLAVKSLA
ncbi:MAG TPA: transposase [Anaerolineae bacterium]|nr:transposase [Anaerolineae bacterium]